MGKASKWFRALLGLKKPDTTSSAPKPSRDKRRWSFVKSYREKDNHQPATTKLTVENTRVTTDEDVAVQSSRHVDDVDPHKHAMAAAAAAATVAEASIAAAQAAAAVVRLTSSGRCASPTTGAPPYVAGGFGIREKWAAVKIQAAYRGCLTEANEDCNVQNACPVCGCGRSITHQARRALRALKGLVKLQALVRGHIERKRTAEWLQRMQALLRAQARARAGRSQIMQTSYSNAKPSNLHLPGPATPDKFESPVRSKSMKCDQSSVLKKNGSKSHVHFISSRSDSRLDEQLWTQPRSSSRTFCGDDERSLKTCEIDSGKPHFAAKRRSLFHSTHHASVSDQYSQSLTISKDTTHQSGQSPSSCEVQSYSRQVINEVEESPFCTANNSPQFYSASSRDGSKTSPFTPTRSNGSRSYLSGYSSYCPNYMANTESSKAKVRSLSAPKQRPYYERSGSSNRYLVHGFGESRFTTHRTSALHASFTSKAYPGSGRLDKLGMPVGYRY